MTEPPTPASARAAEAAARLARGSATVFAGLAMLAALATIWLPPRIPAQDAPLYHLAMEVLRRPEHFEGLITTAFPLTASGVQLAGGLLLGFLDPTLALKVLLSLGLGVAIVAAVELARGLSLSTTSAVVLTCAGYVGWVYAMGFFNFLIASALTSFACVRWLVGAEGRRLGLAFAVLVVATYVHAVAIAFAAAPFALAALLAWTPGRLLRRLTFFAPSAVYAIAVTFAGQAEMERIGEAAANPTTRLGLFPSLLVAPRAALAVYSPLAGLLTLTATLTLVVAVVLALRRLRGTTGPERARRALVLSGLVALAAYLATPLHISAWHFVQPRMLALAFGAPLLATLPARLGPRVQLAVTALVTMSLAAGVGPALAEGVRIDDAAAQLPHQRIGVAYVQIADERARFAPVPHQMVALHVHAYGTLGGGASHFTFPGNRLINLLRPARPDLLPGGQQFSRLDRECMERPSCLAPQRRALQLALHALPFDTLLLPLAPESLAAAVGALGWEPLSPRAFRVGRSGVELRLPPIESSGQLVARAGYPGVLGVVLERKVPGSELRDGATLTLAPLPAGPIVLGAFLDDNGDGRRNRGERPLLTPGQRQVRLPPGAPLVVDAVPLPPPEGPAPEHAADDPAP